MANRYTDIDFNQPVSSYVPMPLDTIYKAGLAKQTTQDKAETERLDLLGKQWDRLKADAEKAHAVKSEINTTLDEFSNKDFNDPKVKGEWYKKKREIADRFGPMGDIGAMEANLKSYRDYVAGLDKLREKGPKEGGIDLGTYNKLKEISLSKYKGIGEDEGQGYNQFSGIQPAGYVDLAKQADELAKGWKESKKASEGWSEDPSGKLYRKRGSTVEWIDENEIYNNIKPQLMADPMNQAFVNQDILLNAYSMPPEERAQMDLDKTHDMYFDRAAKFAANKYGFKSTEYKSDIKNTPWAKGIYDADQLGGGLGQVVPGTTEYNLTEDAPESIKNKIKVGEDGKIKLSYAPGVLESEYKVTDKNGKVSYYSSSEEAHKAAGASGSITQTRASKMTDAQHKDLYQFVKNAADAIGYKGDMTSGNTELNKDGSVKKLGYEDILSEYNKASKAISYDYKLRGAEQKVIKDDMLKDRTNYKYIDEEGNTITEPKDLAAISDPKTFSPDTRVYGKDGKSRISFTYITDKGELKKGLAENLAYEDSNYHKVVGNIQKDALNFYKSGKVENDKVKAFNKNMGFDSPSYKGVKAISVELSPTGKSLFVVLGDPSNRKEQSYEQLDLDSDGNIIKRNAIPNLPSMVKLINKDWYSTEEGKAEAYRIATASDQFGSLLEEDNEQ